MSGVNEGNQDITFQYKKIGKTDNFNRLLRDLISPGFYSISTNVTNAGNVLTIPAFSIGLDVDDDKFIHVTTSSYIEKTAVEANGDTLVINYSWLDDTNNFIDFRWREWGGTPYTNEIIVCQVTYDGGGNVTAVDNTVRTIGGNIYTNYFGIGIKAPQYPLHIQKSDDILACFESTDAIASIYLKDSTTSDFTGFSVTGDVLSAYTAGNQVIIINDSKFVGIGKTPSCALHLYYSGNDVEYRIEADNNYIPWMSFYEDSTARASIQWRYDNAGLHFQAGGASYPSNTAFSITDTGKIGIGIINPSYKIHGVVNQAGGWGIYFVNDNTGTNYPKVYACHSGGYGMFVDSGDQASSSTYAFAVYKVGAPYLYVRGDGNVGIGTASPSYTLDVSGRLHVRETGASNISVLENSHGSNPYGIYITFNGASPDNNTNTFISCRDSTTTRAVCYSDGDWYNHDGTYGTISDEYLKEEIWNCTPKLEDLLKLKVRNYTFKSNPSKKLLGFISQEIGEIFPSLAPETIQRDQKTKEIKKVRTIKTSILIPALVKGMQEQQDIINDKQNQIDELQDIIDNQNTYIIDLQSITNDQQTNITDLQNQINDLIESVNELKKA